jgi:hypothetical protein
MDAAFSFLISAGLIALGAWIVAGTTSGSGSPLVWVLIGLRRPDKAESFPHRTEGLRDSASVVSPIGFTTGTADDRCPLRPR